MKISDRESQVQSLLRHALACNGSANCQCSCATRIQQFLTTDRLSLQYKKDMMKKYGVEAITMHDLHDTMSFGKYKTSKMSELLNIREGRDYLRWCLKTISWFKITPRCEKILKKNEEEDFFNARGRRSYNPLLIGDDDDWYPDPND